MARAGGQAAGVRIAAVSAAFPGKVQDKRVYDEARVVYPPDAKRAGDSGYVGTALRTPAKRQPGGELTARQKAGNRRLSRRRIVAEHGTGKMKVWRVAAERYRNTVSRHTMIMKNVAGLHNLMFA